MDNIERTIQFILDMQAKHEAWLQKHEEAVKRHDEEIAETRQLIAENARAIQSNTARIAQLVDVTLSLARHAEESDLRTEAGFKELREIQATTEYKLNALIETVDKLVRRNGHNTPPQP